MRYWQKVDSDIFETVPPPADQMPSDLILDSAILDLGIIRNATIRFSITPLGVADNFHAAVLFRKNGSSYLGVGLGGWFSYYSVFHRALNGFFRIPVGDRRSINDGHTYVFECEFKGMFLSDVTLDGESLRHFQNLSLRDALACTLRVGHVGLYAYGTTRARMQLHLTPLPVKCFIITNIDGVNGADTDVRRQRFIEVMTSNGITDVEFHDSRDLTREHPLMPRIKQAILGSDFVITDLGLGEPRGNVYYETGIAHSVGIPTIHVGPDTSSFEKVPTDLKQQFFILDHELDATLAKTVRAILESRSGDYEYL